MDIKFTHPDDPKTKHIWQDGQKLFKCGRVIGKPSIYGPFPENIYIEGEDSTCCDECANLDVHELFGGITQWLK